jgi:hypothetical protein
VKVEVLVGGEPDVEGRILEHEPDRPPDLIRLAHHVEAGERCTAAGRLQQRRENLDGGGLPCAIGTEKAENLARADREAGAGAPATLVGTAINVATNLAQGTAATANGFNVFQGVVSANSVTFFGVPVLPPGTTGITRTFRFTNIRVNATALGGSSASGTNPVVAQIAGFSAGSRPTGIAAGGDGNIWVAGEKGIIARVALGR